MNNNPYSIASEVYHKMSSTVTFQNFIESIEYINNNYFISECRIPITELRSISGLNIDSDLYHHLIGEFYKTIPHEVTLEMIGNTLMNMDGDNAMTQYITQHGIDMTKRMRSTPNTYRILVKLSENKFPMNKSYSKKYEKLLNLFHPIMYYLCNTIINNYCSVSHNIL